MGGGLIERGLPKNLVQRGGAYQGVLLVAQTGVMSIHGQGRIWDSLWEIIDVDEEKKRAEI